MYLLYCCAGGQSMWFVHACICIRITFTGYSKYWLTFHFLILMQEFLLSSLHHPTASAIQWADVAMSLLNLYSPCPQRACIGLRTWHIRFIYSVDSTKYPRDGQNLLWLLHKVGEQSPSIVMLVLRRYRSPKMRDSCIRDLKVGVYEAKYNLHHFGVQTGHRFWHIVKFTIV